MPQGVPVSVSSASLSASMVGPRGVSLSSARVRLEPILSDGGGELVVRGVETEMVPGSAQHRARHLRDVDLIVDDQDVLLLSPHGRSVARTRASPRTEAAPVPERALIEIAAFRRDLASAAGSSFDRPSRLAYLPVPDPLARKVPRKSER